MSIELLGKIGFGILMWFVFSFYLWKSGKNEHEHDDLIGASLVLGIFCVIGVVVVNIFMNMGMLMLVFTLIGVYLASKIYKISFWDLVEIGMLWVLLGMTAFIIFNKSWDLLVGYILSLVIVLFVRAYYRRFTWYKSGKSGLVFVTVLLLVSIVETAVAFLRGNGLYFAGIVGLVVGIITYILRVNDARFIQWIKIQKRKSSIKDRLNTPMN